MVLIGEDRNVVTRSPHATAAGAASNLPPPQASGEGPGRASAAPRVASVPGSSTLPAIPAPSEGLARWMREAPAHAKKVASFLSQVLYRARDAPSAAFPVERCSVEALQQAIADVRTSLIRGQLDAVVLEDLADFVGSAVEQQGGGAADESFYRRLLDDVCSVLEIHGLVETTD